MYLKVFLLLGMMFTHVSALETPFTKSFAQIERDEQDTLGMFEEVKEARREVLAQIEKDFLLMQKLAIEAEDRRIAEALRILEEKRRIAAEKKRIAEEKRLALEKIRLEKIRLERKRNYVLAEVNIKKQHVKIYKGGKHIHTWKISSGKKGFKTPKGKYQPIFIKKMHYSKQYNGAPMPYAVFFHKGYAMHGTSSVKRLGRRASHGCVRLRTSNAKKFFRLVQKSGSYNTDIVVN
jgi:lipoprotein-anchoring transpeptidase ErfK/SrfK